MYTSYSESKSSPVDACPTSRGLIRRLSELDFKLEDLAAACFRSGAYRGFFSKKAGRFGDASIKCHYQSNVFVFFHLFFSFEIYLKEPEDMPDML